MQSGWECTPGDSKQSIKTTDIAGAFSLTISKHGYGVDSTVSVVVQVCLSQYNHWPKCMSTKAANPIYASKCSDALKWDL